MAHFYGSAALLVYSSGSYLTAPPTPGFGTITVTASSITFAHVGSTHYRIYLTGGAAGGWVALSGSPVTVSGLTVNTPYTIDLSADGSTVAATVDTGTSNPATGGGEPVPVFFGNGAVLVSATTLVSGTATGGASGTGTGSVLVSNTVLISGTASAGINGTGNGAVLVMGSQLIPGTAFASADAVGNGSTLSSVTSLIGGSASGSATALGVVLVSSSTLISGTASGTRNATGAGSTLSCTTLLVPGTAFEYIPPIGGVKEGRVTLMLTTGMK